MHNRGYPIDCPDEYIQINQTESAMSHAPGAMHCGSTEYKEKGFSKAAKSPKAAKSRKTSFNPVELVSSCSIDGFDVVCHYAGEQIRTVVCRVPIVRRLTRGQRVAVLPEHVSARASRT